VGHGRLSTEARFLAAVLAAGTDAVLSHRSAAALWRLVPDAGPVVDVTVPRKLRGRRGVRMHMSGGLRQADTTRTAGIRVTSPARTLIDLAATGTDDRTLRRAIREALVQRLVDEQALGRQLNRSGGRRGVVRAAAIVGTGSIATRSELEDRTFELLEAHGFPRPTVNARVAAESRILEVDFLFEDRRLIIEADGARFHDNRLSRQDDADRQATLEAAGFHVVRVTWDQVTREPVNTVQRLRRAFAARPPAAPPRSRDRRLSE